LYREREREREREKRRRRYVIVCVPDVLKTVSCDESWWRLCAYVLKCGEELGESTRRAVSVLPTRPNTDSPRSFFTCMHARQASSNPHFLRDYSPRHQSHISPPYNQPASFPLSSLPRQPSVGKTTRSPPAHIDLTLHSKTQHPSQRKLPLTTTFPWALV
jgi:hypothetical protein